MQSGFGNAVSMLSTQPHSKLKNSEAKALPAEIVFKPSPVYTEEARKLRIEGEVLLQVLFQSSGKLRILRVVRGLGHGLDESAIRAAEQIRFKPALEDGEPTDCTAVVHIIPAGMSWTHTCCNPIELYTLEGLVPSGWKFRDLLDRAADRRKYVVGVTANQPDCADDNHQNNGQHHSIFGDVLAVLV
jgi:TonB family protein